jgi:hypothetical protein
MPVALESRVSIPDAVVFRELDGEAVVLNIDSGIYFGLDDVGTRMWMLMAELQTLAAVRDALAAEFDAPADQLARDLLAFVEQLQAKGLVTAV